ncbi:YceD family protein [Bdellovibrio sp. HCB185ZH]|uniref:YceD family protein n=1 Tax=Bdellovibrio sp. HCB185ZH TaxID=3394235 RepID=UPI0039A7271E
MKINLAGIPEDGATYVWTRQTGEANAVLADLIDKEAYTAEFTIRPLNSKDFDMTGKIVTKEPCQCSRCGNDIKLPINAKFHEILIPKQDQPRNSKYSKVNHQSDIPEGEVDFCEYEDQGFDMAEYLHEVIALATPFNPVCPKEDNPECSIYTNPEPEHGFIYNEEMPVEKPESPFAALKNLKLN